MASVRAAGIRTTAQEGGVASCFESFDEGSPAPNVAQWQTMRNPPVGGRTPHWNDPPENPDTVYGIKSAKSESAAPLINPKPLGKLAQTIATARTPKLKTDNKAPNVMAFLPSDTIFGVQTQSSMSAKECLWPEQDKDAEVNEEEFRQKLYLKSHRATLPGEQVERKYSGNFHKDGVMGVKTPCDPNGGLVAKTMTWRSGRDANKTALESERHRAFKSGHNRTSMPVLASDTVFGTASNFDGESVRALITTGNDDDVGSLTDPPAGNDTDEVFGIPTVRLDVAPPKHASVSDSMNYGDQGSVGTVFTPSKLTQKGISVRDANTGRSKDQILKIFEAAQLHETMDFEELWDRTAQGRDMVTIEEFRAALTGR